ncbi:TPM domain-containing protein [Larkinella arboricola]|uniref:TLP18.3/Psb32/MOLO-1 phosphatase superfamily protein n=1 Tax=Larkinella arboricola TaxID=643671 RepID=A0A327XCG9_LARAB|nr:TPM domain-containing protein [Larkinella arboricola]RAK01976.1 TLP18.3/Psb32/MOLO-1 phosphatase superfamily protein [Larkinella arboricola]
MSAINLFTAEEQQQIIQAIRAAEMETSGEVRVHLELLCPEPNVMDRAVQVFRQLGMEQTAQRNGVLFYLATDDRKFAILGDEGIDKVVPKDFWETTKNIMRDNFRQGRFTDGFCLGIERAGQQLRQYFPRLENDSNELSDEISH